MVEVVKEVSPKIVTVAISDRRRRFARGDIAKVVEFVIAR